MSCTYSYLSQIRFVPDLLPEAKKRGGAAVPLGMPIADPRMTINGPQYQPKPLKKLRAFIEVLLSNNKDITEKVFFNK
jgi:hypothetical protein